MSKQGFTVVLGMPYYPGSNSREVFTAHTRAASADAAVACARRQMAAAAGRAEVHYEKAPVIEIFAGWGKRQLNGHASITKGGIAFSYGLLPLTQTLECAHHIYTTADSCDEPTLRRTGQELDRLITDLKSMQKSIDAELTRRYRELAEKGAKT